MLRNKTRKDSLQRRITITLLCFAGAVATLVQIAGHILNEKVEHGAWRAALHATSIGLALLPPDKLGEISRARPEVRIWSSHAEMPASVASLTTGFHEDFRLGGGMYNILVEEVNGERRAIGFEISDVERKELKLFLGAGVGLLVFLFLLARAGIQISEWLSRPVRDLAEEVQSFRPDGANKPLKDNFADSELAIIAEAIDRFVERISKSSQRDKEFSLSASHELRTPISVISGALDVIDGISDLPERALKPLERIRKSCITMEQLSTALLYLSREPEVRTLVEESCELSRILPEIIENHRYLLNGKSIDIRLTGTHELFVQAPRAALTMAIGNLVRNAIENTTEGTIEINVGTSSCTIKDNGTGLSVEQLKKFNSPEPWISPTESGQGIGVYIVRKICGRLAWGLIFKSEAGRGSEVTVQFAH